MTEPIELKWNADDVAQTPAGEYSVRRTDDGYALYFGGEEIAHVGHDAVVGSARDAAKAEAQAHWGGIAHD